MEKLPGGDREILRGLARRAAEIAALPEMDARRRLWKRHNAMDKTARPVIYIDPQRSWCELIPSFLCQSRAARDIELQLLKKIYAFERFDSDNIADSEWIVRKSVKSSGWGLEPRRHRGGDPAGAFGFDPVIIEPSDLKKLRFPEITHDEREDAERMDFHNDLLGDILSVKLKGIDDMSYHLLNQYSALRGLQETMLDMMDNPGMLHDAMSFLEAGHKNILRQYQEQNLLGLNNDSTAIYTSGHGYTDGLPKPGGSADRVRPCDMWGWAEAQETASVSPDMHAEFAFPYEKRLLEPFGLNGYGCCDDVTKKLDFVLTAPNLRRVSVSPWADIDRCAQIIKDKVILMWKPHPAHLVGDFNAPAVREYIGHGVRAARANGCVLEIVLLDTHTCENHPERFGQWAQTTREALS
jgi:hypothetical protein